MNKFWLKRFTQHHCLRSFGLHSLGLFLGFFVIPFFGSVEVTRAADISDLKSNVKAAQAQIDKQKTKLKAISIKPLKKDALNQHLDTVSKSVESAKGAGAQFGANPNHVPSKEAYDLIKKQQQSLTPTGNQFVDPSAVLFPQKNNSIPHK